MARVDKIIKAFNDYDNIVNKYIPDSSKIEDIIKLQKEVSLLICELKRFGCRRKD